LKHEKAGSLGAQEVLEFLDLSDFRDTPVGLLPYGIKKRARWRVRWSHGPIQPGASHLKDRLQRASD